MDVVCCSNDSAMLGAVSCLFIERRHEILYQHHSVGMCLDLSAIRKSCIYKDNLLFRPGISIHKAADRAEEVQAKSDELISQLHALKIHFKTIEPAAVYEEGILRQIKSQEVSDTYRNTPCIETKNLQAEIAALIIIDSCMR